MFNHLAGELQLILATYVSAVPLAALLYFGIGSKANRLSNRLGVTIKADKEDQQHIQWNYYLNLFSCTSAA